MGVSCLFDCGPAAHDFWRQNACTKLDTGSLLIRWLHPSSKYTMETDLALRLELAKLLRKQRELQLKELQSPLYLLLEKGSENKALAERTVTEAVEVIKNPALIQETRIYQVRCY